MFNSSLFSSKSCEWSTPQEFFDILDHEFHFDLDPCASDSNHKCDHYFTISDNGLAQSWQGFTVFCNPPYGRDIVLWVEKAHAEYVLGDCTIVLLLPARTDTLYFHKYIYGIAELRFIRGRLKFGGSINSAPFPSMLAIYRK